jgi:Calx-beta domain
VNGTEVTIAAGTTSLQVRIDSILDTTDEPDETFSLGATVVSGSVGTIGSGTGTILDDDDPPTVNIGDATGSEGTGLVFSLSLSNPSSADIVLDLATSGVTATAMDDFEVDTFEYSTDGGSTWLAAGGVNGTEVTIAAGSTSVLVRIDSIDDSIDESDETMSLNASVITGTAGAVSGGVGTILDNDDPMRSGSGRTGIPLVGKSWEAEVDLLFARNSQIDDVIHARFIGAVRRSARQDRRGV